MTHSAKTVTIRDVAKLAGVSPATVSKVLNNKPYVSAAANARVLDAISKLNFRANTIARSLKLSKTMTIGLITDDLEGFFTMSMMRGVEDIASAQGFSVFLCNSYGKTAREKEHLEVLLAKQVDGIILLSGYRVRERGAPAMPIVGLPVVYLYQYTLETNAPCIVPDDFGGGKLATRYLLSLGHRRIGFINGPAHYEAAHARQAGYQEALTEAGVQYDPALVRVGKWHENSGYQLAHQLMRLSEPPSALFCASDSLAVGALDAIHELNLRVPEDVALVGFDNRTFSQYQRPPLTTVALPFLEMGRLAGQVLVDAISSGTQEHVIHQVSCQLIKRQSCGGNMANQDR